jgi:hypothetical protein
MSICLIARVGDQSTSRISWLEPMDFSVGSMKGIGVL